MLAPTAAHAMLSLNEELCCKSRVMKAWLNCLESARASIAAATGAIASIFDVSMVGGAAKRGRSEPRGVDRKQGSHLVYKFPAFACGLGAAP